MDSLYQCLFEQANEAIFLLEDGQVTLCNQQALTLLGLSSKNDLVGRTIFEFAPTTQEDEQLTVDYWTEFAERLKPDWQFTFEWLYRRGDEVFFAEATLRLCPSDTKDYLYLSLRDITIQKQLEKELAQRAAELQTISQFGRAITTILEPKHLLQTVIDLTLTTFDSAESYIYRVNNNYTALELVAGSGSTGQLLVEAGITLPLTDQETLIGRVFQQRDGLFWQDRDTDAAYHPVHPALANGLAQIAVPITLQQQVIGVLTVISTEYARFSGDDMRLLKMLAEPVAIALHNAQLFEMQAQASTQVQLLYQAAVDLNSARSLASIIKATAKPAFRFEAQQVVLWQVDLDQHSARMLAEQHTTEFWPTNIELSLDAYDLLHTLVTETRHVILLSQITDSKVSVTTQALYHQRGIQATALLPLILSERQVGVLQFDWTNPHPFRDEEWVLYHSLARQTAVALDNHFRFIEMERRTSQLELLGKVERRLAKTQTEAELLETLVLAIEGADQYWLRLFYLDTDPDDQPTAAQAVASWLNGASWEDDPTLNRVQPVADMLFADQWLIHTDRVLFVEQISQQYSHQPTTLQQAHALGIETVAIIPLHGGGYWQGLLMFAWPERYTFSDDERFLLDKLYETTTTVVTSRRAYLTSRESNLEVERLATIVRNHTDFIGVSDAEGNALYINPAGLKMMGMPETYDVSVITVVDFYPLDEAKRFVEEIVPQAFAQGYAFWQTELLRVDGTSIPVDQIVTANYDTANVEWGDDPYSFNITMRDISHRLQSESELLRRQENLIETQKLAKIGRWTWEVATNQVVWDEVLHHIFDVPLEVEPSFELFMQCVHPADVAHVQQGLQDALQSDDVRYMIDHRIVHRNGEMRYILGQGQIVRHADGQPARIIGTAQDVTIRRKAELVVREQQELLQKVIDYLPVGLIVKNIQDDYRFTIWNNHVERLFGIAQETVLGKTDFDIFDEPIAAQYRQADLDALQIDGPFDISVEEIMTRHGPRKTHTLKVPINDQHGQLLLIILEDITERIEAEEALKRRQERMALLYRLTRQTAKPIDEQLQDALRETSLMLDLPIAIISEIQDNSYTVRYVYAPGTPLQPGAAFELTNTYCDITVMANRVTMINNMGQSEHNYHAMFQLESYIGTSLWVGGRRFGTLNFSSSVARSTPFASSDIEYIELLAQWVSSALERRVAEAELKQSEARYRDIVETAAEGIWMVDAELNTTFVNATMTRLIGYNAEQLIGQSILSFIASVEHQTMLADLTQMTVSQDIQQELRFTRQNGQPLWVSLAIKTRFDPEQKFAGLLALVTDITSRREVETAQRRLSAVIEAAPGFVGMADAQGKMLYLNPAGYQMIGLPTHQPPERMQMSDFVPPRLRDELMEQVLPTVRQTGVWSDESSLLTHDGEEIPVLRVVVAQMTPDGEVDFYAGIMQDISELKRTQKEINQFFDLSLDLMCIADLQGYFRQISPAFERTLGWSEKTLLSQPFINFVHSDDVARTLDELASVGADGQPLNFENRYRCADGSYRWLSWIALPSEDGLIYATARDVTAQKESDQEREDLLAEIESSYRQFVLREWDVFVSKNPHRALAFEYLADPNTIVQSSPELPDLEQAAQKMQKIQLHQSTDVSNVQQTMVAPVLLRNEAIGTFILEDNDTNWDENDLALVESVLEQLALTMENLRLLEETQKRATREELTRQITDKMRATPDMETIIQTGLDELSKALGVHRAYIKLTPEVK